MQTVQQINEVTTSITTKKRTRKDEMDYSDFNGNKNNQAKRISDSDIKSIFDCLHYNKPIPAHISFTIVPSVTNGEKLSPPNYQFNDGIYILLRPYKIKKHDNKNNQTPSIPVAPASLQHLMMNDFPIVLDDSCKWSLSGAQFPQPTILQQRYCYPKSVGIESEQYCAQKGGSLWTMYTPDGKEDLSFRILHVYFSAKRASNRILGTRFPSGDTKREQRSLTIDNYAFPRQSKAAKQDFRNNFYSNPNDLMSDNYFERDYYTQNECNIQSMVNYNATVGPNDVEYQPFRNDYCLNPRPYLDDDRAHETSYHKSSEQACNANYNSSSYLTENNMLSNPIESFDCDDEQRSFEPITSDFFILNTLQEPSQNFDRLMDSLEMTKNRIFTLIKSANENDRYKLCEIINEWARNIGTHDISHENDAIGDRDGMMNDTISQTRPMDFETNIEAAEISDDDFELFCKNAIEHGSLVDDEDIYNFDL